MTLTVIRRAPRRRRRKVRTAPGIYKSADPLDVAGAKALRDARAAVLALLEAAPRAISAADVEAAISAGGGRPRVNTRGPLERAVEGLVAPLSAAGLRAARDEARRRGLSIKAREEPRVGTALDLRIVNPAVVDFAERRSAELVVEVSDSTREALRELVRAAVSGQEGIASPRALATAVRSKVGLHSRWARAVFNYQMNLEANGTEASRVADLTSRYYDRLLRARANVIARTEIMRSANEGKVTSWRTMQQEGFLGNATARKRWIAAPDAEEICTGLDGQTVGLDGEFEDEEGETYDMPPAHPNCRCTAILVVGRD